jgi:hypothetical protein
MDCKSLSHIVRYDENALQHLAYNIAPWQEASAGRALSNITSLMIAVGTKTSRSPAACSNLKRLFDYMPNLTNIRLNGSSSLQYDSMDATMDAGLASLKDLLQTAPVTKFELGKISVSYSTIQELIQTLEKRGRIEAITLFRVSSRLNWD